MRQTHLVTASILALDQQWSSWLGRLVPVINPAMAKISMAMYNTTFFVMHYIAWDAAGRSVVIELSGPKGYQYYDNTDYGVLANNPLYPAIVDFYKWYNKTENNDNYVTIHDSLMWWLPGAFNSSYRFTRAYMLQQPAATWEWQKDIGISPGFVAPGIPDTNPAMMAAMDMIQNLWLPKGLDDAGGTQAPGMNTHRDITWIALMRDHKNTVMYYRVANTPLWKRIQLLQVQWSKLSRQGVISYTWIKPGTWWSDETMAATIGTGKTPPPTASMEQQLLLEAFDALQ